MSEERRIHGRTEQNFVDETWGEALQALAAHYETLLEGDHTGCPSVLDFQNRVRFALRAHMADAAEWPGLSPPFASRAGLP